MRRSALKEIFWVTGERWGKLRAEKKEGVGYSDDGWLQPRVWCLRCMHVLNVDLWEKGSPAWCLKQIMKDPIKPTNSITCLQLLRIATIKPIACKHMYNSITKVLRPMKLMGYLRKYSQGNILCPYIHIHYQGSLAQNDAVVRRAKVSSPIIDIPWDTLHVVFATEFSRHLHKCDSCSYSKNTKTKPLSWNTVTAISSSISLFWPDQPSLVLLIFRSIICLKLDIQSNTSTIFSKTTTSKPSPNQPRASKKKNPILPIQDISYSNEVSAPPH